MVIPEFEDRLLGKLEVRLEDMMNNLRETDRDIPAASREVAIGIIHDKIALLRNRPISVTASAVVHIDNREVCRGETTSILLGQSGARSGKGEIQFKG